MKTNTVPKKTLLLFWIILGMLTTFIAESLVASTQFPLFDAWSWMATNWLYAFHLLFFAGIVFMFCKPRFSTLYFAGVLFGLYEAYITKVIWNPTWDGVGLYLGGVSVYETFILIAFWHPLMAFIIPLLIADHFLLDSRLISGFPKWIQNRFSEKKRWRTLLFVFIGLGFYQGMSPTFIHSLGSAVLGLGPILFFSWLWKRKERNYSLDELLPKKKGLWVLAGLLLVIFYGFWTAIIRPDELPGIGPQASVWFLYLIFIFLLVKSIKKDRRSPLPKIKKYNRITWKQTFILSGVFTLSAMITATLTIPGLLWLIISAPIGGLYLMIYSIRDTFK